MLFLQKRLSHHIHHGPGGHEHPSELGGSIHGSSRGASAPWYREHKMHVEDKSPSGNGQRSHEFATFLGSTLDKC